mgnify:CR=1 FL=1
MRAANQKEGQAKAGLLSPAGELEQSAAKEMANFATLGTDVALKEFQIKASLNEAGEPVASSGAERKITKAERAFDRVMRESSGLPGSGGSSRGDAAKLAELEKMSRDNRIKERLAALKAGQTDENVK